MHYKIYCLDIPSQTDTVVQGREQTSQVEKVLLREEKCTETIAADQAPPVQQESRSTKQLQVSTLSLLWLLELATLKTE